MGIRSRLKAIKQFVKDPQGWTESHGSQMNVEYAKHSKSTVDAERAVSKQEKGGESSEKTG